MKHHGRTSRKPAHDASGRRSRRTHSERPAARLRQTLTARDPGHARLTRAVVITAGVLCSTLLGLLVIRAFHADSALLCMSVFLSLQSGNMVKDSTAGRRLVTTVLLAPTVVGAMLFATLMSQVRPALIAGFIAIAGAAIWVRRYGPRASALGAVGFIGYFFTLFMHPSIGELPVFLTIAAVAVASQVLARLALMARRPQRQIEVLLHELRTASLAALQAASRPGQHRELRSALARSDEVGRAITQWQQDFDTERHIACSAEELESRVLDVRVHTEVATRAIDQSASQHPPTPQLDTALAFAQIALLRRSSTADLSAARGWVQSATDTVTGSDAKPFVDHAAAPMQKGEAPSEQTAIALIAAAIPAYLSLRAIDLSRGLAARHASTTTPAPPKRSSTVTTEKSAATHGHRTWSVSSRMSVQVMLAAAIASIAGEMISATRWYWAVLTAFVVFIGTTTRGSLLTRALRRIIGTLIGILVGGLLVTLSGGDTSALVIIAVVSVLGVLYFGPVNYLYTALFITTMLVAMYRMLGILDPQLLELRLAETITGAVVGVLCVYLILSASSRPMLKAQVEGYFDALSTLTASCRAWLTGSDSGSSSAVAPGNALHRLEDQQASVDSTVSGMSTAFLFSRSRNDADAVHLMFITTRSAAQLVQAVTRLAANPGGYSLGGRLAQSFDAIATHAGAAEAAILGTAPPASPPTSAENAVPPGSRDDRPGGIAETAALNALARMEWALERAGKIHV